MTQKLLSGILLTLCFVKISISQEECRDTPVVNAFVNSSAVGKELIQQAIALAERIKPECREEQIRNLWGAVTRNPENLRANLLMGILYGDSGNEYESQKYLEKAAQADTEVRTLLDTVKQKRAMADMRAIATSIEAFAVDNNYYPYGNLTELRPLLEPNYIRTLPLKDPWNNSFVFRTTEDKEQYVIICMGSDGKLDVGIYRDGFPVSGLGYTHSADADIIFSNGTFVRYPITAADTK